VISSELTKQHFNVRIYRGIVHYVRTHYPHVNIEKICEDCGLPFSYLQDDHNWVSVTFANQFTRKMIQATGCEDISYLAAFDAISPQLLGRSLYFLISRTLSPQFLFRQISAMTNLFSKVSRVNLIRANSDSAQISLFIDSSQLSEIEQNAVHENLNDIVRSTLGYYAAIPRLKGLPAPHLSVVQRSANLYEFTLQWINPSRWKVGSILAAPLVAALAYLFISSQEGPINLLHGLMSACIFLFGVSLTALWAWYQTRLGVSDAIKAFNQLDQRYLAVQKERERADFMAGMYKKFVPETVLQLLGMNERLDIPLGHHREGVWTCVFIDLRGFSKISEDLDTENLFQFLNSYYQSLTRIIEHHKGVVSNFSGDGMLSLFPQGSDAAIRAAVDILEIVKTRYESRTTPIAVGCGVATGKIVIGTVGSQNQMDVMISSDAVNTAARLEKMTKTIDSPLLIDAQSYELLSSELKTHFDFLGPQSLAGKDTKVSLYSLKKGSHLPLRASAKS
jgi:class 3 adenylate cyclase